MHRLKGGAAVLGAESLERLAEKIEKSNVTERRAAMNKEYENLCECLEQTCHRFADYLQISLIETPERWTP